jgi:hypothetical protein
MPICTCKWLFRRPIQLGKNFKRRGPDGMSVIRARGRRHIGDKPTVTSSAQVAFRIAVNFCSPKTACGAMFFRGSRSHYRSAFLIHHAFMPVLPDAQCLQSCSVRLYSSVTTYFDSISASIFRASAASLKSGILSAACSSRLASAVLPSLKYAVPRW